MLSAASCAHFSLGATENASLPRARPMVSVPPPFRLGLTEVSQGSRRCTESREWPGQEKGDKRWTQADRQTGRAGSKTPNARTDGRKVYAKRRQKIQGSLFHANNVYPHMSLLSRRSLPFAIACSLLLFMASACLAACLGPFPSCLRNRSRPTHMPRPDITGPFKEPGLGTIIAVPMAFIWEGLGRVQRALKAPPRARSLDPSDHCCLSRGR